MTHLSTSASSNGWQDYPAAAMNKAKPSPLPLETMTFWKHCIDRYGGPILEAACGNGRWIIPLAGHGPGYDVVGIDLNEGLIETARSIVADMNASGNNIGARFVVGDIVNMDLGQQFGLVIMTSWTWPVLLTQEDQIRFLERVRAHLRPGGAFAFNAFMPEQRRRSTRVVDGRFCLGRGYDDHGDSPRWYDAATQIEEMDAHGGGIVKLRHTNLSEFRLLFRLTGFELVEIYGDDHDMRPFTGAPTDDYTILAERRG